MLTQEGLKELFDYNQETWTFKRKVTVSNNAKIGDIAWCLCSNWYLLIGINWVNYYSHRLAWLYVYWEFPKNKTDHINGIKVDNRISNLRDVNSIYNNQNRGKQKRKDEKIPTWVQLKRNNWIIYAYISHWTDSKWKQQWSKSFSINKFGEEIARTLAIEYRNNRIADRIKEGAQYTDRHWL